LPDGTRPRQPIAPDVGKLLELMAMRSAIAEAAPPPPPAPPPAPEPAPEPVVKPAAAVDAAEGGADAGGVVDTSAAAPAESDEAPDEAVPDLTQPFDTEEPTWAAEPAAELQPDMFEPDTSVGASAAAPEDGAIPEVVAADVAFEESEPAPADGVAEASEPAGAEVVEAEFQAGLVHESEAEMAGALEREAAGPLDEQPAAEPDAVSEIEEPELIEPLESEAEAEAPASIEPIEEEPKPAVDAADLFAASGSGGQSRLDAWTEGHAEQAQEQVWAGAHDAAALFEQSVASVGPEAAAEAQPEPVAEQETSGGLAAALFSQPMALEEPVTEISEVAEEPEAIEPAEPLPAEEQVEVNHEAEGDLVVAPMAEMPSGEAIAEAETPSNDFESMMAAASAAEEEPETDGTEPGLPVSGNVKLEALEGPRRGSKFLGKSTLAGATGLHCLMDRFDLPVGTVVKMSLIAPRFADQIDVEDAIVQAAAPSDDRKIAVRLAFEQRHDDLEEFVNRYFAAKPSGSGFSLFGRFKK